MVASGVIIGVSKLDDTALAALQLQPLHPPFTFK
jgi:hypothetical protein